jgi:hypothetical protein
VQRAHLSGPCPPRRGPPPPVRRVESLFMDHIPLGRGVGRHSPWAYARLNAPIMIVSPPTCNPRPVVLASDREAQQTPAAAKRKTGRSSAALMPGMSRESTSIPVIGFRIVVTVENSGSASYAEPPRRPPFALRRASRRDQRVSCSAGTAGQYISARRSEPAHPPAGGEEEVWCLRLPVTRFGIEAGIPGFLLPGRELLDSQASLPPNTGIALASP